MPHCFSVEFVPKTEILKLLHCTMLVGGIYHPSPYSKLDEAAYELGKVRQG